MQRSRLLLPLALLASGLFIPDVSQAQLRNNIQRPINTPTFSPYLNLFRGNNGGGPVLNYYGLVRPQMQAMQQADQFGQNLQQLQRAQRMGQAQGFAVPGGGMMGTTGHPVVFQSFNTGAVGGGAGIGGGGGAFGGAAFGGAGFAAPAVGGFGGAGGGGFGAGGMGGGGGIGGAGGFGAVGGGGMIGGQPGIGAMPAGYTGVSGHPAVFGTYGGP
ncbi:MAG: hypothetical protein KDA85_04445, partial [Planctomycetaceae bacterium]|nr:hypothetical protein [Planctomycetaceae bacterium]